VLFVVSVPLFSECTCIVDLLARACRVVLEREETRTNGRSHDRNHRLADRRGLTFLAWTCFQTKNAPTRANTNAAPPMDIPAMAPAGRPSGERGALLAAPVLIELPGPVLIEVGGSVGSGIGGGELQEEHAALMSYPAKYPEAQPKQPWSWVVQALSFARNCADVGQVQYSRSCRLASVAQEPNASAMQGQVCDKVSHQEELGPDQEALTELPQSEAMAEALQGRLSSTKARECAASRGRRRTTLIYEHEDTEGQPTAQAYHTGGAQLREQASPHPGRVKTTAASAAFE